MFSQKIIICSVIALLCAISLQSHAGKFGDDEDKGENPTSKSLQSGDGNNNNNNNEDVIEDSTSPPVKMQCEAPILRSQLFPSLMDIKHYLKVLKQYGYLLLEDFFGGNVQRWALDGTESISKVIGSFENQTKMEDRDFEGQTQTLSDDSQIIRLMRVDVFFDHRTQQPLTGTSPVWEIALCKVSDSEILSIGTSKASGLDILQQNHPCKPDDNNGPDQNDKGTPSPSTAISSRLFKDDFLLGTIQQEIPRTIVDHNLPYNSNSAFLSVPVAVENKTVWINIERLHDQAGADYWMNRLGWEATTEFNPQIQQHKACDEVMHTCARDGDDMPFSSADYTSVFKGELSLMNLRSRQTKHDTRFESEILPLIEIMPSFEVAMNHTMGLPDANSKLRPRTTSRQDYCGALEGFLHNVRHFKKRETWIATMTSVKLPGPVSESLPVTSPDLKMAKTIILSENACSSLGIFKSPIAADFDFLHGESFSRLSMLLHIKAAEMLQNFYPRVQFEVLRPLKSMDKIFNKAGIPTCTTTGLQSESEKLMSEGRNLPHIVETQDKRGYVLLDPVNNTRLRFPLHHWFSTSPFLLNAKKSLINAYPFVTMRINDLANPKLQSEIGGSET